MKILRNLCSTMLLMGALTSFCYALPEGANVQAGSVNINTNGNTQTIQQLTDRAIVNWNGFNIDIGELVHFVQPSSVSAILNRVVGQDPSMILGAMRANGQVFLINPNGVVFGQTATVDVGSLVVSTLNITDQDFMAGRLEFEQEADKDLAAVINHGTIKIDDNGYVVLTGPMVANDGVILARVGQVAMAAGTKTTVSFDPTGMIQLELPTDANTADGIVSLSQADAGDLISSVVNTPNVQAGQIVVRNGQTFLEVASGTVVNAGDILAEGQAGENGGRVLLDSTANTILAESSIVSAAGMGEDSSGGEVFVLSDQVTVTEFGSLIDVSGGLSGDGGFVEQSSLSGFVGADVQALANDGEIGTFLIDPPRIVVETGAGQGGDPMVFIPENTLESAAANIMLVADFGVDFQDLNGGSLLIPAGIDLLIDLNGASGNGAVTTFADTNDRIILQGSGSFTLDSETGENAQNLKVVTDTGDIDIDLAGGAMTGNSSLTTENGRVDANVTGTLVLVSDPDQSTGSLSLGSIAADDLIATGDEFRVYSTVDVQNDLRITATGSIENGVQQGFLSASTLTLGAQSVGSSGPVNFDADTLNVTADLIDLNGLSSVSVVNATNLSGNSATTITAGGGDDTYIDDSGGLLSSFTDQPTTVSYTFSGDRGFEDFFPTGDVTLTTSGNIDGTIASANNLTVTANDIYIDVSGGRFGGGGIAGQFTGVATNGDVTLIDFDGNDLTVDLTATGLIDVNGEAGSPGDVFGSANAPIVFLAGTNIGTVDQSFQLGSRVTELEVLWDTGSVFLEADSPTLDVYAEVDSFANGEDFTLNNLGGDIRVGTESYIYADNVILTASGSITTEGFSDIDGQSSVSLSANSINAHVATSEVFANATQDVVLTQEDRPETLYVGSSTNGSFTVNHLLQDEFGGEGSPAAFLGPIDAADTITINAANSGIAQEEGTELAAPNVILSTVTEGISGNILVAIDAQNLVLSAEGSANITSNGNSLTASIDAFDLFITGVNLDLTVDNAILVDVVADNDAFVDFQGEFLERADIVAGNTASFTTLGSADQLLTFEGTNLILDVGGDFDDSLSATGFVQVTADDVALDVTASQVTATARTGDVTLTGTNANIGVAANSQNGNVDIDMNGNIIQNAISGNTVSVTANGGNITQGTGRVAGTSVALTGNNVAAQTATSNLTVNLSPSGNATIGNDSTSLNTSISTSGDVSVTNTGTLSGNYTANNLKLEGSSVDADISATRVEGDATGGNVVLDSTDATEITVTNSSAPNGDFTLNHNGDVVFDTINAQNVTINTSGDITDVANTIVASGITLNGDNILINTQGQVIVINAQGNVSVANTLVDVSSLTIDAQGNVTFGTDGNLTIAQVTGGQLVSLTAGGNISGSTGSAVNGTNIEIFAGGSITPNLNGALQLNATNSILVQAQGDDIAAALQGGLPASAVVIQTPAGPIFYNGVLLNGPPDVVIPEIIPEVSGITTDIQNQIGQTQGQVVDDGSVGSAANDGIVEESPTQKLVAQLTETAGGGGGSGPTTQVLITLEIDQLGEVKVELSEPSPFDQAIDENENMSADDVLDLDTEELADVEVGLYYDPAKDQLIMAVNLSADDVLDLDVSDYVKIPVQVNYQIQGDPALMIEKLRANDIIDLEVEDLGEIPIKVHVSGERVSEND